MALTEIYVDPSIAADSGAGTIGDPYGDLEYAIEQETFDATNGTRVNIKAGTDEVLAVELSAALADTSVSIAWAPDVAANLVFQGYTSAAGDGGVGGISGGGSVAVITDAVNDFIHMVDLHLHNCGSATIVQLDADCSLINCELDNTSGAGVNLGNMGMLYGCYLHNIGGIGATGFGRSGSIMYCHFANGANDFTNAIQNVNGTVYRNVIQVDGTTNGIVAGNDVRILQNSVWSNGGSGNGIALSGNSVTHGVTNNVVEGFSGSGGNGFSMAVGGSKLITYGGNSAYNNETDYTSPSSWTLKDLGDNETLSASPFTDAANGDFSPVDTGNVKEGALPQIIGGGLV